MPSKSHALGRTNHQRWLRLRGIGQRSDLSELAVLAAQFFNRTELNGALRTGLHADGLQTGFETVKTAVALAHLLGDRIEDRCMVRASHGASAAADALESAQSLWGQAHRVKAATVDLNAELKAYQALQGREIWKHDGTFIEKYQPTFGPGVKERFAFAKTVYDKDLTEQESSRATHQWVACRFVRPDSAYVAWSRFETRLFSERHERLSQQDERLVLPGRTCRRTLDHAAAG